MIAALRDDLPRVTTTGPDELAATLRGLGRPRVLVVGDAMLDQYVAGDAERLSQEAPVPLLRATRRDERAGGAANVALALAKLGANVAFAGVVGADRAGERLRRRLVAAGVDDEALVVDPSRPTTRKRRYIAAALGGAPRQVLRVDVESREPLDPATQASLLGRTEGFLQSSDIILVSDYDKGVCTSTTLRRIVDRSRRDGKPTLVDPPRLADFARYRGVSCLTPNRPEAALASGVAIDGPARALEAAEVLRIQADAEAMLVTLDEQGMVLIRPDGSREHHPAPPREVRDTTGAGDAVLAMLGLCLACDIDYGVAVALANLAGGIQVERWGVTPLRRHDLLRELQNTHANHHADLTVSDQ